MAVTITRAQLAARMRLGRTQTELDEVDHLLAEATEAVIRLAPDCPDVIHNMAVWRYASYSYDRPFASADTRFSNVMRNSGAAAALLPYRNHRLGLSGDETTTAEASLFEQQSPFDAPDTPVNIAAGRGNGRYRAELTSVNSFGVLYAVGHNPPATDTGYFLIARDTDRSFDFTVGSGTLPVWVKSNPPGHTESLAVARYAA